MTTAILTRPERTTEEIAADRKAASAFFARFEGYNHTNSNKWRDVRRQIIEYERFDYKLLLCVEDGKRYLSTHNLPKKDREARALANELARNPIHWMHLQNQNLRSYVPTSTQRRLPIPRLGRRATRQEQSARNSYFQNLARVSERRRGHIVRELDVVFEQWLLLPEQRHYGPHYPAPEGWTASRTRPNKSAAARAAASKRRSSAAEDSTALEIALRALDSRGGRW